MDNVGLSVVQPGDRDVGRLEQRLLPCQARVRGWDQVDDIAARVLELDLVGVDLDDGVHAARSEAPDGGPGRLIGHRVAILERVPRNVDIKGRRRGNEVAGTVMLQVAATVDRDIDEIGAEGGRGGCVVGDGLAFVEAERAGEADVVVAIDRRGGERGWCSQRPRERRRQLDRVVVDLADVVDRPRGQAADGAVATVVEDDGVAGFEVRRAREGDYGVVRGQLTCEASNVSPSRIAPLEVIATEPASVSVCASLVAAARVSVRPSVLTLAMV